jgi:hypothetical protein
MTRPPAAHSRAPVSLGRTKTWSAPQPEPVRGERLGALPVYRGRVSSSPAQRVDAPTILVVEH